MKNRAFNLRFINRDVELHTQLKIDCVKRNISINKVIINLIKQYLEKNN